VSWLDRRKAKNSDSLKPSKTRQHLTQPQRPQPALTTALPLNFTQSLYQQELGIQINNLNKMHRLPPKYWLKMLQKKKN
jgi:hypothetical protein